MNRSERMSLESVPRWERIALAGGIGYVILMLAAATVGPQAPGGDSFGAHPQWLAAHQTGVLVVIWTRSVAALMSFAFTAGLVSRLVRDEGRVGPLAWIALAGGIGGAAFDLLGQIAGGAAVEMVHSGVVGPAVQTVGALEDASLTVGAGPYALLCAACGIAFLANRAIPRWLAWGTLLTAAAFLVGSAGFDGTALMGAGFVALPLSLLWRVAASITLLWRSTERTQDLAPATARV